VSEFEKLYQSKRISGKDLVGLIKPGNRIQVGMFFGQPYGAIKAIDDYAKNIDPLEITIVHATGPWSYMNFPGVTIESSFLGPFERWSQNEHNNVYFIPVQFSDAQKLVRGTAEEGKPFDFMIFRVAPMDERGYLNFSLTNSWEYNAMRWLHKNSPKSKIVLEVNPNMPRVFGLEECGSNEMHISEVDYIIEDQTPLANFPTEPITARELEIGKHVAALVEDRSTIQLGFGKLPRAIGSFLKEKRELGIHTEMFCEAHVDLIEAGAVTNTHKGLYNGKSIATFTVGEERMRNFCRENPAFAMAPVEMVNDVRTIAQNYRMVSINSILTIDLNGQACAHCIGPNIYSGVGGAFEFAYGSQLATEGKSILALPSTTKLKNGTTVSNILARHDPGSRITIPEHTVDWVVTEFGAARLKLLNMEQRARALLKIAHPDFRDELTRQAIANGLRLTNLPS